ncbi:alpha-1-antitrypsin-like [Bufo bufo]|uniref:alpha-1-antitrypsin-like n=1 Tax=Bufo bufo TaxID=8384 RepID=UPI001ABDD120|nr:alpha-1-antitrypsin-like [Bufo bufo]
MRVLLLEGVALLITLVFADHHKGHRKQDKDDYDDKDSHDHRDHHNHKKGEHHDKKRHHHHNKSLPRHKIADYNSKFSFDLFRQLALDHPSENIVFSPVSISMAFAFLSLGAKAQNHSQIIKGLRLNTSEISEQDFHEGFHHRRDLLNDVDMEPPLRGGSALFISKERKILQTFLDEAKKLYHSEAFSTDFKNTEEAKNQINSYVEKNTHSKIPEPLDSVDQDAIFVLIDYIYFRGQWENPFEEEWTKEEDFHVNENTTVKVPFMSRTGMYKAAFTDEATVVCIPYKGNAVALFVLPNEGKLSEVEQNFKKESIKTWKKSIHRRLVDLYLPKFSVSGTVNLKETLSKLGIEDNADLSGITGEPNENISKAIHKAALSVDEGTEAAATTAREAISMMHPSRITFNRPFIISVYDYKSQSILFTGRIANPQE